MSAITLSVAIIVKRPGGVLWKGFERASIG